MSYREKIGVNMISPDKKVARDSYGNIYKVGDVVTHDSAPNEPTTIESFSIDHNNNEILAHSPLGSGHIDFLDHK